MKLGQNCEEMDNKPFIQYKVKFKVQTELISKLSSI
jgi:hypothetical protein